MWCKDMGTWLIREALDSSDTVPKFGQAKNPDTLHWSFKIPGAQEFPFLNFCFKGQSHTHLRLLVTFKRYCAPSDPLPTVIPECLLDWASHNYCLHLHAYKAVVRTPVWEVGCFLQCFTIYQVWNFKNKEFLKLFPVFQESSLTLPDVECCELDFLQLVL